MNIQNNTNELVEVLNMVNMLGNDADNGSGSSSGSGNVLPTFDYATGTATGDSDGVNVQCNWTYGSTGPADLVILYGYKWIYSNEFRILETLGCPLDGKFHSTSNYNVGGGIISVAEESYTQVYCYSYNGGFTIRDNGNSGYPFSYVAYKFNHIS